MRAWEEWRKAKEGKDVLKTFGGDSVPYLDEEGVVWTRWVLNQLLRFGYCDGVGLTLLPWIVTRRTQLYLRRKVAHPPCTI